MRTVSDALDSLNEASLKIIETGNQFTRAIAQWVSVHPESEFVSVDLNFQQQLDAHVDLEAYVIARYCRFLTKDHNLYLSNQSWADVVFLNPSDLQAGLMEFLLAVSTGARLIVMKDYQTQAALAIKRAKEIGWIYESVAPQLILLRRP